MELEHQALIYKYIDANVPVPSSLLVAIRKSLGSSGFPSYSPGSLRATESGGRCRRTDGEEMGCSRDAVADQKYCERHMNRGRHRSRKPVKALRHAAKAMPIISPTASVSPVVLQQQPVHLPPTNQVLAAAQSHLRVALLQVGNTTPSLECQLPLLTVSSGSVIDRRAGFR
ncbi:unnamed protein product [Spirodela intermedia]|uniref:Growth-regulating factor n=1 Tax=Spirodela intermedia TaxID=51605 RepID=A0ABN7EBR2_SPIIN|nr:unnamed protein product [Spirodela intermedia]